MKNIRLKRRSGFWKTKTITIETSRKLSSRIIDFNAFYTIDKGRKRDLRDDFRIDVLHKDNIKISSQVASTISGCINYLIIYEKDGFWNFKNVTAAYPATHYVTSKAKQIFFTKKKEELILNIPLSLQYKSKIKLVSSSIKAAIFILQKQRHPDLIANFWEQLYSDSPVDVRIASLRTHLAMLGQKKNMNYDLNNNRNFACIQSIVICWNSIVEDRRYNTFKGISKYFNDDEIIIK